MEYQVCKKCEQRKELTTEFFCQGSNRRASGRIFYWYKTCRECDKDRVLEKSYRYKRKNRKLIADKQKIYHANNKENDSLTKKKWYQSNKDSVKLKMKNWIYNRRATDPVFRLKDNISCRVRACIKKNRQSITKFLPYTIQELKNHLEKQFEPWMTWENYGVYREDIWDDNNMSTWTWQIDHIIPHSAFKYESMKDQEFLDCWALSNLRPYSAKQNVKDSNRKYETTCI